MLVKVMNLNKGFIQSFIGASLSIIISLIIIYMFDLMVFGEGIWSVIGAILGGVIAASGFKTARFISKSSRSVLIGGGFGIILFGVYAYSSIQEIVEQINNLVILWLIFQALTLIFFPEEWLRNKLET